MTARRRGTSGSGSCANLTRRRPQASSGETTTGPVAVAARARICAISPHGALAVASRSERVIRSANEPRFSARWFFSFVSATMRPPDMAARSPRPAAAEASHRRAPCATSELVAGNAGNRLGQGWLAAGDPGSNPAPPSLPRRRSGNWRQTAVGRRQVRKSVHRIGKIRQIPARQPTGALLYAPASPDPSGPVPR